MHGETTNKFFQILFFRNSGRVLVTSVQVSFACCRGTLVLRGTYSLPPYTIRLEVKTAPSILSRHFARLTESQVIFNKITTQ